MKPLHRFIRRCAVDLAALELDEPLFARIVQDLKQNAAEHRPARVWADLGGGGDDAAALDRYAASELLTPWLGFGSTPITRESLFWYYEYLCDIDSLGLMPHYFTSEREWRPAASDLLVADLGTLVDLNLMHPFLSPAAGGALTVVEVGGGYGRLAEAFFNVFAGSVKYVLVDAVPASLVYSDEYLRRSCPDLRVGFYYRDDPFDLDRFDCYIVPTWHAKVVAERRYDLAVNVQSMQEMDQHQVDHYLGWFDSVLAEETGIVYLCNRRDHLFRGEWRYPDHWECLLKQPTPRSWIRDFPAEVYRRGVRDHRRENDLRQALYRRELETRGATLRKRAARLAYEIY